MTSFTKIPKDQAPPIPKRGRKNVYVPAILALQPGEVGVFAAEPGSTARCVRQALYQACHRANITTPHTWVVGNAVYVERRAEP